MKKLALITILFLLCKPDIFTQVVRSGKVTIHISNKPQVKAINGKDSIVIQDKVKTDAIFIDTNKELYGNYYALIIGIDNYTDTAINRLTNRIDNANLFHKLITAKYVFEKDNVSFLEDATLAQIKAKLDAFSLIVGPKDNFLIFYTGQSYWDPNTETGYWLPSDAREKGFWLISTDEEESSKLAWLSNKMLSNYLQKIKSKHTLIIADASFGGSVFKNHDVSGDQLPAPNMLNELTGKKAIINGVLPDLSEQSDFTKCLINDLENNTEEYLPSQKLFINFSKAISNKIRIKPQFGEISNMGDEGGDFIFILRERN
jgi:hypothetical protein